MIGIGNNQTSSEAAKLFQLVQALKRGWCLKTEWTIFVTAFLRISAGAAPDPIQTEVSVHESVSFRSCESQGVVSGGHCYSNLH